MIDLGPDLIKFDQVEDFEIDITETTREEKRTVNGEQVSYDPPHILYMETFTLRMKLNHPYIKSVYVQLNNGAVQIKNLGYRLWTDPGRKLAAHLLDLPGLVKEEQQLSVVGLVLHGDGGHAVLRAEGNRSVLD